MTRQLSFIKEIEHIAELLEMYDNPKTLKRLQITREEVLSTFKVLSVMRRYLIN